MSQPESNAAPEHDVCGPDCTCGCEVGRTIPIRRVSSIDTRYPAAAMVLRRIEWLANEGNLTAEEAVEQIASLATSYRLAQPGDTWNPEHEGNKLILLFEGYIYGDKAVSESMVVAAIQRFRTEREIELNPDWQADRG